MQFALSTLECYSWGLLLQMLFAIKIEDKSLIAVTDRLLFPKVLRKNHHEVSWVLSSSYKIQVKHQYIISQKI